MRYPSDLSDAEWECVQRYSPSLSQCGRPRTHPLRRILDAIFYIVRTWLRLAVSPQQLYTVANRVLPLPSLAPAR